MPQILTFDVFASNGDDGVDGLNNPGGRLTLESGVPLSASDQTAKTTVYYTAYLHSFISLFAAGSWTHNTFGSEKSVAVPSTTNTPFDVFGYLSAGDLALETVNWTNDTTRATALVRQDGFWVKSGDATRLYLGTCRTTAVSGQCEDSQARRLVWNQFNREARGLKKELSGSGYTYNTNTYRQTNADTANQVDFIIGLTTSHVWLQNSVLITSTVASAVANIGIGLNSTTATSAFQIVTTLVTVSQFVVALFELDITSIGYTFLAAIEKGAGSGTQTWTPNNIDRGLIGGIFC